MKTFYALLINTLLSSVTVNFLWFAVIFWAYLETRSVLATSIIGGSYMLLSAVLGLFFGTYVDHHKKKTAMMASLWISLTTFAAAGLLYVLVPRGELLTLSSPLFWLFVILILGGAVAGNMRSIALSTTVSLLVPEKLHDKANGMVGTVNGVSFVITSVFSGLAIGMLGMGWALSISIALIAATMVRLTGVAVKEKLPTQGSGEGENGHDADNAPSKKVDIRGAMAAVALVPGLMALIFFSTFNNFLGGVYMSLMDAYGLNLVSVEAWGIIWGVLSCGFIIGGIIVAKKGLGKSPLRTLFVANLIMWLLCIIFPIRSSIALMSVCMLLYMVLIPVIEAAEQTIIQKVVPVKKQGRVFGFAQSLENAASPITAFLIGPLAELVFIPLMSDGGAGARAIGSWFGTGQDRGMALVFMIAGLIGLLVTAIAMASRSYHLLNRQYAQEPAVVPSDITPRT